MIRTQAWTASHSVRWAAGMVLALALWSTDSAGTPLAGLPALSQSIEARLTSAYSPDADSSAERSSAVPREFWLPGPELDSGAYVRSYPFGEEILATADRHDLDPLLLLSVVEVESNFHPDAVSPKGAMGLMQVMPVHVEEGLEPFDPVINLELGATFLSSLERRFDGDLGLAIGAYHAGAGAVERFDGIPPYASTRLYVERVLEVYRNHYRELVLPIAAAGPVRQSVLEAA